MFRINLSHFDFVFAIGVGDKFFGWKNVQKSVIVGQKSVLIREKFS